MLLRTTGVDLSSEHIDPIMKYQYDTQAADERRRKVQRTRGRKTCWIDLKGKWMKVTMSAIGRRRSVGVTANGITLNAPTVKFKAHRVELMQALVRGFLVRNK